MDARSALDHKKSTSVPIAELATLGAGVSSLIPALNTVTTTTTLAANGLFRIANQASGDVLKMDKNGNFWGAMHTATGGSKLVQLAETGPLTATSQAVATINPATMMMAVALYSIERHLGENEFLQDSGAHLKKNAIGMEKEAVHCFASASNPGTRMFIDRMEDMIQIYNHTEQIFFDDKKIYLVSAN